MGVGLNVKMVLTHLWTRSDDHTLHPEADESKERSERFHNVCIIGARFGNHASQFGVAVGSDHRKDTCIRRKFVWTYESCRQHSMCYVYSTGEMVKAANNTECTALLHGIMQVWSLKQLETNNKTNNWHWITEYFKSCKDVQIESKLGAFNLSSPNLFLPFD